MYTGLLHTYETLAHLLFLVAMLNLVLVLAKAGSDETIARLVRYSHEIGILWFGRAMLLIGCGVILTGGGALQEWGLWASILLWGPVEALGRRFVKTELRLVEDGGLARRTPFPATPAPLLGRHDSGDGGDGVSEGSGLGECALRLGVTPAPASGRDNVSRLL